MRARPLLPLLVAALALSGRPVRAAGRPIELRIPDCASAPFSLDAFLRSLRAELAGRTPPCCALAAPGAAGDDPGVGMRVTLAIEPCDAGTEEVIIRVLGRAGSAAVERRIALGDIAPETRPRALALAVAELVRTVSQETAAEAPGAEPPSPPITADAPPPDRRLLFSGLLELRTHPGQNMTLWAVRPGVGLVRDRWRGSLELEAATGDPAVPLGDVNTHLLALAVDLGPRFRFGDRAVDLGAVGSLGWAWMGGHTLAPGSFPGSGSALVASAGVRVGVNLSAPTRHTHFRLLFEAGGMGRGVTATVDGRTAAGLTDAYLLGGLGVEVERPR